MIIEFNHFLKIRGIIRIIKWKVITYWVDISTLKSSFETNYNDTSTNKDYWLK